MPEYLHKMFKSMHLQVIEINAFCNDFYYQLSFFGIVKEYVSIMNKYVLLRIYAEICSEKCR